MSIISTFKSLFQEKTEPTKASLIKGWRRGMWVMHGDKIAVIAVLDEPAEIHYTDTIKGENIGKELVPLNALRQAKYSEIPEGRRMTSREAAEELGYGA